MKKHRGLGLLLCHVFLFFQTKNSAFSNKGWGRFIPNLHYLPRFNPNNFFPTEHLHLGFLPQVMLGNVFTQSVSAWVCVHIGGKVQWKPLASAGHFPPRSQQQLWLGKQKLSNRSPQPLAPPFFPPFHSLALSSKQNLARKFSYVPWALWLDTSTPGFHMKNCSTKNTFQEASA